MADLWSVFAEGVSSLGVSLSGLVVSARSATRLPVADRVRVIACVETAGIALDGVVSRDTVRAHRIAR